MYEEIGVIKFLLISDLALPEGYRSNIVHTYSIQISQFKILITDIVF